MSARLSTAVRDRRAQLLVAAVAVALAAAAVWLGPARAAIVGVQDGENLRIDQQGATSTLFQLKVLAPGEEASGVVTLGNDGALPGALRLALRDLRDETGAGGVPFSEVLQVRVADVTDAAAPAALWQGTLASLGQIELGRLSPSAPRSFRVTVAWPDGGAPPSPTAGDNAYSGARSRFVLAWGLLEDAAPTPPGSGAVSAAASRAAVVVRPTASRTCVSRRRFTIRVKRTRALRPTSATILLGGTQVKVLRGKRLTAVIDLRGRPKQTVTVRIRGRTRSGRPYRETRTYRTCVPKAKSRTTTRTYGTARDASTRARG